jgi:hypothetical protein
MTARPRSLDYHQGKPCLSQPCPLRHAHERVRAGNTHVSVRLDDPSIVRLDALLPMFGTPWRKATRSDALRAIILDGLPRFEARQNEPAKPAGRSRTGGRS